MAERWQILQSRFAEGLAVRPSERPDWLAALDVGGDEELRREVGELLAAYAERPPVYDQPVLALWRTGVRQAGEELVGLRVGDLELVEVIGRGVSGLLLRTERRGGAAVEPPPPAKGLFRRQAPPAPPRRDVVEVLGPDVDPWRLEERFVEAEPRLRSLAHPALAPLRAAITDDRRACLIYTEADGEPIDVYCDRRRLAVPRRTALLREVCEGVQHAHQRLVVHGALSPTTILVSPDGRPRVLGFGATALVDGGAVGLAPAGPPSRPRYAAPEQHAGEMVTTAADTYALGVVLYQLLTGVLPHADADDTVKAILEEVPPRPSQAVKKRGEVAQRRRLLTGDLDTVVMRALSKDPDRRYSAARNLGDDLYRWSLGRPVRARRDTMLYRAWRFVGRHSTSAVLALLLFATLAVGAIYSYQRAENAVEAEADARRAHADAMFVSDYLAEVLGDVAAGDLGNAAQVIEVLEKAEEQLAEERESPEAEARLRGAIARVYAGLSLWSEAERNVRQVLALADRSEALSLGERATNLDLLGEILYQKADPAAIDVLAEAVAAHREADGDANRVTALASFALARALVAEERWEEAAPHAEHAMRQLTAASGIESEEALAAGDLLVRVLKQLGRHDEAISWQLRLTAAKKR